MCMPYWATLVIQALIALYDHVEPAPLIGTYVAAEAAVAPGIREAHKAVRAVTTTAPSRLDRLQFTLPTRALRPACVPLAVSAFRGFMTACPAASCLAGASGSAGPAPLIRPRRQPPARPSRARCSGQGRAARLRVGGVVAGWLALRDRGRRWRASARTAPAPEPSGERPRRNRDQCSSETGSQSG